MISIYYFCLLIIFYINLIWTYQCLKCATEVFNHLVTPANLSFPTEDDCNIVHAVHGCYVHIDWQADGTTEVLYKTDPALPFDSILMIMERQVNVDTGVYSTRKSVSYTCRSTVSPCNTIDNIKRVANAITFPSSEQRAQLDSIISPTKRCNVSSCSNLSNMKNCPKTDLNNCQQCMSVVQYTQHRNICSTCSTGNVTKNYFAFQALISLNAGPQWERVILGCQRNDACNSMKNIEEIKQKLAITIDLKQFHRSTASTINVKIIFLLMTIFRLIE